MNVGHKAQINIKWFNYLFDSCKYYINILHKLNSSIFNKCNEYINNIIYIHQKHILHILNIYIEYAC